MAYKGVLMVDDETLFRAHAGRRTPARSSWSTPRTATRSTCSVKQALAGRAHRAELARADAPAARWRPRRPRAIALAELAGAPLYVVHLSCPEAVEPVARARENGLGRLAARPAPSTSSSTIPTSSGPASRARSTSSRRRRGRSAPGAPLGGLADGRLSVVSTDHGPSASRARRSSGRTTSRRSPTAGPASRSG